MSDLRVNVAMADDSKQQQPEPSPPPPPSKPSSASSAPAVPTTVAQLQQALASMAQDVQLLRTESAQLRADASAGVLRAHAKADAATAAATAAAAASAAAAVRRERPVRIGIPKEYDGSATKLEGWLSAIRQQCRFYHLADDEKRIDFASASLSGHALEWWEHLDVFPTTWEEFDAALHERFQPVTSEDVALIRIRQLVQGKLSINDYVSAFRGWLVYCPRMDRKTAMSIFAYGLKDSINTIVRQQQPATLEEAIKLAVRVGTSMPQASSAAAASSSSRPSGHHAMNLSAAQEQRDGTTDEVELPTTRAELNAIVRTALQKQKARGGTRGAGTRGPRTELTPEQLKERYDKAQCFHCGVVGHYGRDCEKRKAAAAKPPGN